MISSIINDSWNHPWEGFMTCFIGCSQDEIDWVDESYQDCEQEIGWPKTGSISWHLNHVAACKNAYTADIKNPNQENNESNWAVISKIELFNAALKICNDNFVNACLSANPEVKIQGKGGMTLVSYIGVATRHEIWHAGQIALLRRLYKQAHL